MYCVYWKNNTNGYSGHGEGMELHIASAWVDALNRESKENKWDIIHWLELIK